MDLNKMDRNEAQREESKQLVAGPREQKYGHPKVNYKRIALIWSAVLGVEVTPIQAVLCELGVKFSRLVQSPDDHDTQVDIHGYLSVLQRLLDPDDAPRTIPVPLAPLAPSVNPLMPPYVITYSDGSKDMTFEEAVGLPRPDPNTGSKYMHREVKPTKDLTPEETRVLLDTGMYWYLTELNRLRGGNSCGQ